MKKILTIENGVEKIAEMNGKVLPDYFVKDEKRYKTVCFERRKEPLLIERQHTKFRRISTLEMLGSPCAVTSYVASGLTLDSIMFQEFDLCEWWLKSEIVRVTSYICGNCANVIVHLNNETTASLQLCSTPYGCQSKHELFTTGGMASDRAVDTLIASNALNVFTKDGATFYTDTDISLYGLTESQIDQSYCIYNTIFNYVSSVSLAERLNKIVDAAMLGGTHFFKERK